MVSPFSFNQHCHDYEPSSINLKNYICKLIKVKRALSGSV